MDEQIVRAIKIRNPLDRAIQLECLYEAQLERDIDNLEGAILLYERRLRDLRSDLAWLRETSSK